MAGEGRSRILCREPWENYYILRRGILPCCHGWKPIAPMAEWQTAWNNAEIQEIRSYLVHGQLSPYCLLSVTCPIVQRHMDEQRRKAFLGLCAWCPPAAVRVRQPAVRRGAGKALPLAETQGPAAPVLARRGSRLRHPHSC